MRGSNDSSFHLSHYPALFMKHPPFLDLREMPSLQHDWIPIEIIIDKIFISTYSPLLSSKEEKSCFMIEQSLKFETMLGRHFTSGEIMHSHPFTLLLESAHLADLLPLLGFLPPVGSSLGWTSSFSHLLTSLLPLWPSRSGWLGVGQQLTANPKESSPANHWGEPWLYRLHPGESTDSTVLAEWATPF